MVRTDTLSDEELIKLILSHDTDGESFRKLLQYRQEVGQIACVRKMLVLFQKRVSAESCKKAWDVILTVCLTDDEPEMDYESSQLWTESILEAMKDSRPDVREAAARVFHIGLTKEDFDECIIRALMEGLADESEGVRFSCGQTLQHAGRRVLPGLLQALLDSDYQRPHHNESDKRSSVWDILFAIDGILNQPESNVEDRRNCIEAISSFLKARSVNDEMDYLDIWKAGDTLGQYIGGREVLEILSDLIGHDDFRVRRSVAHALSHIEDSEAVHRLKILVNDREKSVRDEAVKYMRDCS